MRIETPEGPTELGPGDEIIYYENEPHGGGTILGDEPVELLCVIDCVDGGENCNPEVPQMNFIDFVK